jgi:hypothetical protein
MPDDGGTQTRRTAPQSYPRGSCLSPFGQSSPSGTEIHGAGGSGG